MQLIYVNRGASPSKFAQYLKQYNKGLQQQGQKYNQLLMEGLTENGAKVCSLSTRPINRAITSQKFFKGEREQEKGIDYIYIPFFNVKLLREISVMWGVFIRILFAKGNKRNVAIICDALNITAAAATLVASWLRGFQTVGIVTDVPCHRPTGNKIPLHERINLWLMRRFGSYLLLTEQMNDVVNPKGRPNVVLEGHSDIAMSKQENTLEKKHEKKVCFYAGSLRRIYGISYLVQGFLQANVENTELHIYGKGDFEKELETIASQNPTVKYMGVAPNDVVVEEELRATLLVNPRPTNEDYTKYSFPSKNMEYMASGTPVLTTKLPGMPEEYYPYVYLLEEESAEGMAKALKEILSKPAEELAQKGAEAKKFVMEKKNNISQAKKLLDMLINIMPDAGKE